MRLSGDDFQVGTVVSVDDVEIKILEGAINQPTKAEITIPRLKQKADVCFAFFRDDILQSLPVPDVGETVSVP